MRLPDWESRFNRTIEEARKASFRWGAHDCALFACDCIQSVTGCDVSREFRGTYSDEATARKAVRSLTGNRKAKLTDAATSIANNNGFEEVQPLMARRGDAVLIKTQNGPALGVVSLSGCNVLAAGTDGLVRFPLSSIVRAWRIG